MRRVLISKAAFLLVFATLVSGAWGQTIAPLPPDICPYPEEYQPATPFELLVVTDSGGRTTSATTPEPTTIGLVAIGVFMAACKRRRRV
jgi:hypothetical protein